MYQTFEFYIKTVLLILLNFIEGLIAGFISIIIAAGIALFYYSEWNKYSIAFMVGAVLGCLLFVSILAGIPLWFIFS